MTDFEHPGSAFPLQGNHAATLVYLDSAATTQRPRAVLDAIATFYTTTNANVHRASHALAARATQAYEAARQQVARSLGVHDPREIVFLRGTTEAVNLVAASFAAPRLGPGTAVVVTELEHHSNLVPWQRICRQTGAELRIAPIQANGDLELERLAALLDDRVRLLALCQVSNVLGTHNPIPVITAMARRHQIPVFVDGAQAVAHLPIDVQALGCDFYAFSGHKTFGPMGSGALWGRRVWLEQMPPWQSGGEMVDQVTQHEATFAAPPQRFEAGTPDVAGAVGLAAALRWLDGLGRSAVARHDAGLLAQACAGLRAIPGVRVLGAPQQRVGVVAFTVDALDAHELAALLDADGIAIRAGHHCAQPLHARLGVVASARASFACSNTAAEVDRLIEAVQRAARNR